MSIIRYNHALDIQNRVAELSRKLGMKHIDPEKVVCIRSIGSKTDRIIARCHALSRIMKFALGTETHYVIEVISEQFDILSEEERTKTLIHELMHIPKSFGGGFRYHSYVNRVSVEKLYRRYKQAG